MIKVITYGTYDLLHYGHIRLLKRAKALGDYLIVGVTADIFDKTRGKINVKQSLMERIEAVRSTGIADEILVEEYEGQKIDDIRRYEIDIFTVGSDWIGKFDYLREYCQVVYLERTEGVSSSEMRAEDHPIRLGIVGERSNVMRKYAAEAGFVNSLRVSGVCSPRQDAMRWVRKGGFQILSSFEEILQNSDAVYIASPPKQQYFHIKTAIECGKRVLCESPVALSVENCVQLFDMARERNIILMEGLKTAYTTAYNRLLLLVKSGYIGQVYSVGAVCTSLVDMSRKVDFKNSWGSLYSWGSTALLPIFQILGTDYENRVITTHIIDEDSRYDVFTKIDFLYPNAVASAKVAIGAKSERELVISGSKGYFYVPAPWWKTDYFEIRYENPVDNKRYFYHLDGEGIRYMLIAFAKSVEKMRRDFFITERQSEKIAGVMEDFYNNRHVRQLRQMKDNHFSCNFILRYLALKSPLTKDAVVHDVRDVDIPSGGRVRQSARPHGVRRRVHEGGEKARKLA